MLNPPKSFEQVATCPLSTVSVAGAFISGSSGNVTMSEEPSLEVNPRADRQRQELAVLWGVTARRSEGPEHHSNLLDSVASPLISAFSAAGG